MLKNCEWCEKEISILLCLKDRKRFCSVKCYREWQKERMKGDKNPAYRGGKVLDKNGYIRMRGNRKTRRYEHQFVMEQYLGRKLLPNEEVHHINGIKSDNRIENLFLVDKKNHTRKHYELFIKVQKLEWENKWLTEELIKYREGKIWRIIGEPMMKA